MTLFLTLAAPALLMADGNPWDPPPGGNGHFELTK
jgi:hypothetical protein